MAMRLLIVASFAQFMGVVPLYRLIWEDVVSSKGVHNVLYTMSQSRLITRSDQLRRRWTYKGFIDPNPL